MELARMCEYEKNGICIIASRLVNAPVEIPKNACQRCLSSNRPKKINYVTIAIAGKSVPFLRERLMRQYFGESLRPGIGTELHFLLEEKGFKIEKDCSCIPLIHEMNAKGVIWAAENVQKIAVEMQREYKRRFPNSLVPNWLLGVGANRLISQAIERFQNAKTSS